MWLPKPRYGNGFLGLVGLTQLVGLPSRSDLHGGRGIFLKP